MPMTPRRTYESLACAARRTAVSVRTVRRRIAPGDLPAYRCGRLIRVDPDDVERMLVHIPTTRAGEPERRAGRRLGGFEAVHSAQQSPH